MRAGALLRLGRNLRKTGRNEEALQAYGELAQLGRTPVLGLPAELVAREASSTVLEAIGKGEELRREASLMHSALWSGRWSLLRPAWEFHVEEAQRWSGASPLQEREQNALALSIATESIYGQWIAEPESKGRRILKIEGKPVLISWAGTLDRLAAVLAGPGYLASKWAEALQDRRAQGALIDADGQVMIGLFDTSGPRAVRTAPAASLPGTLHVTSTNPGADDYVTKPFSPRELRARVKAALRRTAEDDLPIYRFGDAEVDFERCELRRAGKPVELTALEFKLLTAFVRNGGKVLSRDRLLDLVWGHATFVTDRVVDNHVVTLRKKVEPEPSEPRYIVSVRGMGYRFDG